MQIGYGSSPSAEVGSRGHPFLPRTERLFLLAMLAYREEEPLHILSTLVPVAVDGSQFLCRDRTRMWMTL